MLVTRKAPDFIAPAVLPNNQIVDSKRSLGLGLALCKSIINAHGGTISVSDHKPHGALFCFTLPETKIHLEASLLDNQ